ncbi:MAG: serine hydrolase [Hyphomicrobiaceae bacterium]
MIANRNSTLNLCLGLVFLVVAIEPARAETNPIDPSPVIRSIESRLETYMHPKEGESRRAPPALSVAVAIDGEYLFSRGFGEARPGVRADAETRFHIGSLTKQLTAAAVLLAVERGAHIRATGKTLKLDTVLSDVFDGVDHWSQGVDPPITLSRLLTMSSNLSNFSRRPPPDTNPWGTISAPHLLSHLKKFKPFGWPNSFEYSNTSYFLLAEALDALSDDGAQRKLYQYRLRQDVFEPSGMTAAGFTGDDSPNDKDAMPHYRRRPAFDKPDWLKGSGDVVCSATDLRSWNIALMSGRVLSNKMRDLMFSDGVRVDPLTWYGMGWFVRHPKNMDTFSHSGSVPGFTSFNTIVRSTQGDRWASVTLLASSDGLDDLDELAEDIVDIVMPR